MSDVNINIKLVTAAAEANARKLAESLRGVDDQTKKASKSVSLFGGNLNSVFTIARGVFLGNLIQRGIFELGDAIVDVTLKFAEFERGLISIGKTADIDGATLANLGEDILELSQRIPVATDELLRIGTIAGQLGIKGSADILKFTETVARLGFAVEGASVEEFAQQLSRIAILTQTPISQIDQIASSLVGLGNNLAANEAQIASTALEVAKSTAQYKLSAQDVLGLSGALAALGNSAEISGSATQRILRQITNAAAEGGPKLQKFVEVTGLTAEEFKTLVENSPVDAILALTKGLGELSDVEVTRTLNEIGLAELRVSRVTNSLAAGYQELTKSLATSRDEFQKNTAATRESDRAFNSTAGQIDLLKTNFAAFTTEVSQTFNPIVQGVVSRLTTIAFVAAKAAKAVKEFFLGATPPDTSGLDAERAARLTELTQKLEDETKKYQNQFRVLEQLQDQKVKGLRISDEQIQKAAATANQTNRNINEINREIAALKERQKVAQQPPSTGGDETGVGGDGGSDPRVAKEQEVFDAIAEIRRVAKEQEQFEAAEEVLTRDLTNQQNLEALAQYYTAVEIQRQQDRLNAITDEKKKNEELQKITQQGYNKALEQRKKFEAEQEKLKQKELQTEQSLQNDLQVLARAGAKEAIALSKAIALRRAIINIPEAASNAYTYGNDIGGPPLGAVFAAVATAAQLARVNEIRAVPTFQNGGIVPGNNFSGDRVDARVNSGEMILNRRQQSQLFQMANGQGGVTNATQPQEIVTHVTVEIEGEAIAKAVSRQVADGFVIGENQ